MADPPPAESPVPGRWSRLIQQATDPFFVLNAHRRLLFANAAWERLAGFPLAELRGRVCKRRRDAEAGSVESVLTALSPPRHATAGSATQVRRLLPQAQGPPRCWDVTFLPLRASDGALLCLGSIVEVAAPAPSFPPLPEKLLELRRRRAAAFTLERWAGATPAMQRVAEQVRLARPLTTPVLLCGEAGSGKEWLARAIHHGGPRGEGPFVALDCLHLPPSALAPFLFGAGGWLQRPGATLYFRDPWHLPRDLQARLLETVTAADPAAPAARILAGTSRDPAAEVRAGRWLEEWSCWLSPLTIQVPPLRERLADLPALAAALLERLRTDDTVPPSIAPEALEVLRVYTWPGNVAELQTVLAGAVRRAEGGTMRPQDLPWYLAATPAPVERHVPLDELLEKVERRLIQLALVQARGNRSKAAELLGIWRPRLLRRIEALGIDAE